MGDRTNAERQRRYIARLKARAVEGVTSAPDTAEVAALAQKLAQAEQQLAAAKARILNLEDEIAALRGALAHERKRHAAKPKAEKPAPTPVVAQHGNGEYRVRTTTPLVIGGPQPNTGVLREVYDGLRQGIFLPPSFEPPARARPLTPLCPCLFQFDGFDERGQRRASRAHRGGGAAGCNLVFRPIGIAARLQSTTSGSRASLELSQTTNAPARFRRCPI
jgi:hypothetical protein